MQLRPVLPLLFVACLPAAPVAAEDSQIWVAASTRTSLSGPLELHADMNARWVDSATHLGHFQVRGMLGWRIRPGLLLGGGYSYVQSDQLTGQTLHEHRLFQQLNSSFAQLGKAQLTGRTRLEQRKFEHIPSLTLRLRQQVTLTIPVGTKGVEAVLETEPFFVLATPAATRTPTGLNQLRSFAGLNVPISRAIAVEAGYLNQLILAGDDRANHILSISLSTRF